MNDWARDLRRTDVIWSRAATGAAKGRYEVVDVREGYGLWLRKISNTCLVPQIFTYDEVEEKFHPLPLGVEESRRFGEKSFVMVRVHYDDGRVVQMPWVEGGRLELEGFEGVSFEHLGFVDARASVLPVEELWVHQHDLVEDSYRFMGDYLEPAIGSRPTNPDIDDEEDPLPRRRRGRGRSRR